MPRKAKVRRVSRRFRGVVAGGMLLAAMGASACTANPSAQSRDLPVGVASTIEGVHAAKCTLNSDGTHVVAVGRFNPPAALPTVNGQQAGALQLYLYVRTKQTFLGVHNVQAGSSYEGISVGQTSWRIVAPVEQGLKLTPTSCEVAYGVFQ